MVDETAMKALRLMEIATVTQDLPRPVKTDAESIRKAAVAKHKKEKRERKAIQLLNEAHAGEAHKPKVPPPLKTDADIRQEAIAKYKNEIRMGIAPAPKFVPPKKMEKMAETTRKKKLTPEDVRDPETVAGMKYQIDYDREKEAQEKALQLIRASNGSSAIV